jgi:hypothetical protein
LTQYQVHLSYNIVYLPSLKYGLPSTSLSFKQTDNKHKFAVDKFLSGMDYDRSTARALIYGPPEFRGFGIRHLYTEMLGMNLDTVVSHLCADTQLGKAFRINLNYFQLTAVTTEPILESQNTTTVYQPQLDSSSPPIVTFHYLICTLQLKLPAKKQLLLYCNNKSVVKKLTSRQELRRTINQHRHPDVDIKMQVLHDISLLEAKGCYVTIQHLYVHQDTQKLKHVFTAEEHLNIIADELTHRA